MSVPAEPWQQFKRVTGPQGTLESICMLCLHTVAICSSSDELTTGEKRHDCHAMSNEMRHDVVELNRSVEPLDVQEDLFDIAESE